MADARTIGLPNGVTPVDVQAELARILRSREFVQSERMRRFLSFVVDRSLAGDLDALKEYTIGLEVFDRPPSYDPRIDSIVRVEARRLRRKLRKHYESSPAEGPIKVSLPEGRYAPLCELRDAAARSAPEKSDDASGSEADPNTIAVLPFVSLSREPENEYFADGLTDEIISTLAKAPPLRVVSRTSVFQFKNQSQDIRSIGERLGVDRVLEGSVRKAGDSLRVTAQLVNVRDGLQMWSERFDRKLEDIFALQEEIAGAIAGVLRVRIAHPESEWKPNHVAPGPAILHVLEGRHFLLRMTPLSLRSAMESFQRAVQADPEFSYAYSAIAACLLHMSFFGDVSPESVAPHARRMIERALHYRSDNSWAYTCRGILQGSIEWKWDAAETAFKRSIEINAAGSDNHCYYAVALLAPLVRFDEAIEELGHALQSDPGSLVANTALAMVHYLRGDNEAALEQYEHTLSLSPAYYGAHRMMSYALIRQGDTDQAVKLLESIQSMGETDPRVTASLGFAYASAGNTEKALEIADSLEQASTMRYVAAYDRAMIRIGLGEYDTACDLLHLAVGEQECWLSYLNSDPIFDPLREKPAFQKIMGRVFATARSTRAK